MYKKQIVFGVFILCIIFLYLSKSYDGKLKNNIKGNENNDLNTTDLINVTFAAPNNYSAVKIENIIKNYNDNSENKIKIKFKKIPVEKYDERIGLMFYSGEGPDLFQIRYDLIYYEALNEFLADLTQYVEKEGLNRLPQYAVTLALNPRLNGNIYSLPSEVITYRMIYNKSLFLKAGLNPEKPPQTMQELYTYAKQITNKGKGKGEYGFVIPAGDELNAFYDAMEVTGTFSGKYYYDFKKGAFDLKVYKPWFNKILQMKEEGILFPDAMNLQKDEALTQFAFGKIGIMFVSNRDILLINDNKSSSLELGVSMPVVGDIRTYGKYKLKMDYSGWYAINQNTKNFTAAFKIWKYFYSDEYLESLCNNEFRIPINYSKYINIERWKKNSVSKFLPLKQDSLYPEAPDTINDRDRFKSYKQILSGEKSLDSELTLQNNRLNIGLNDWITTPNNSKMQHIIPNFTQERPEILDIKDTTELSYEKIKN